jgi:hypothetical protein
MKIREVKKGSEDETKGVDVATKVEFTERRRARNQDHKLV